MTPASDVSSSIYPLFIHPFNPLDAHLSVSAPIFSLCFRRGNFPVARRKEIWLGIPVESSKACPGYWRGNGAARLLASANMKIAIRRIDTAIRPWSSYSLSILHDHYANATETRDSRIIQTTGRISIRKKIPVTFTQRDLPAYPSLNLLSKQRTIVGQWK